MSAKAGEEVTDLILEVANRIHFSLGWNQNQAFHIKGLTLQKNPRIGFIFSLVGQVQEVRIQNPDPSSKINTQIRSAIFC
jgi:hypothetical protein